MTHNKMSVSGYVWRAAMDRPFVVRATIGQVKNEIAGSYNNLDQARLVAAKYADALIWHAISGEKIE